MRSSWRAAAERALANALYMAFPACGGRFRRYSTFIGAVVHHGAVADSVKEFRAICTSMPPQPARQSWHHKQKYGRPPRSTAHRASVSSMGGRAAAVTANVSFRRQRSLTGWPCQRCRDAAVLELCGDSPRSGRHHSVMSNQTGRGGQSRPACGQKRRCRCVQVGFSAAVQVQGDGNVGLRLRVTVAVRLTVASLHVRPVGAGNKGIRIFGRKFFSPSRITPPQNGGKHWCARMAAVSLREQWHPAEHHVPPQYRQNCQRPQGPACGTANSCSAKFGSAATAGSAGGKKPAFVQAASSCDIRGSVGLAARRQSIVGGFSAGPAVRGAGSGKVCHHGGLHRVAQVDICWLMVSKSAG